MPALNRSIRISWCRCGPVPVALLVLSLVAPAAGAVTPEGASENEIAGTTVVLVRHAERDLDHTDDPGLGPMGKRRARILVKVLADAGIEGIYATQYRRTRKTAEPLAQHLGLEVQVREIAPGAADAYAGALAYEVLNRHAGQAVLVIGHSNTVPALVEAFSGRRVGEMSGDVFDDIYIVSVTGHGTGRVIHARYPDLAGD